MLKTCKKTISKKFTCFSDNARNERRKLLGYALPVGYALLHCVQSAYLSGSLLYLRDLQPSLFKNYLYNLLEELHIKLVNFHCNFKINKKVRGSKSSVCNKVVICFTKKLINL